MMDTLHKPITEWPALLEAHPDKQELEQSLSALIQRATLLEAYLSHRWNTGCGDQGHDASARHAERVLGRVRKALGFSYPNNLPTRF